MPANPTKPVPSSNRLEGSGVVTMAPRISPPGFWRVWKFMYALPAKILGSCAARVVLLPSGKSHLPVKVPPTPLAKGVTVASFGLLSLKGEPKNPQTTGFAAGGEFGPA